MRKLRKLKKKEQISETSMDLGQLNRFVNSFKIAINQKQLYFVFRWSNDLDQILKILQKERFIRGYFIDTKAKTYTIYLSYDIQGICTVKKVKKVSSISQRVVIKAKQMKAYLNDFPSSLGLIRTKWGIMSIKESYLSRIGGEFLISLT